MNAIILSRRAIVFSGLSAAGGLAIALPWPAEGATPTDSQNDHPEMTAWLIIDPDNTVTIRIPHQEMGQGTVTALAMLLAEELECDWTKVRFEYASSNRNQRSGGKLYGSMATNGSRGVRGSVAMMQQAGASARERLRVAAAQRWRVDPSQCAVELGHCLLVGEKKSLSFGELAPTAALVKLEVEPPIKTPEQYKIVGKWTPRLDTQCKINGSAEFGIDVKIPGMVYAAVVSCPEFGAKLKSIDATPIQGMRGIIDIVKMDDAVAVVADRWWRAKRALDRLKIEWASGANATVDSDQLYKAYRDALDGPMVNARNDGDVIGSMATPGATLVEAVYEAPYLAHAPMEPMNCTVKLQSDRVDVWLGTQSPMTVIAMVAKATGIAPDNVYIHNAYLGGGFGRRGQNDEVLHAIACARQVKKPVKLVWHREQDIRRDRYRPQAAVRFKAAIGADKMPTALASRVACGSLLRSLGLSPVENGIEPNAIEIINTHAYSIPNRRVDLQLKNAHVPVMFWRSVGASQNTFFLEGFVDEMAVAADEDPYQFRRKLLSHRPDYVGVLDLIAEKSSWGTPLPSGRGRGIAICEAYGTIAGQVAEVTISPDGKIKVDRVVAAVDCYHAANPNTIEQQIEGGVIWGLTAALYGEITIKNGAPVESNFGNYPLLGMAETPQIETYLHLTGGKSWGGIGEPSAAPIAPAVVNAIFAATGKRIRKLPIRGINLAKA